MSRGDRLHALLCAAGYNIRWLLRMIAKKGVRFLAKAFLCLIAAVRPIRLWLAQRGQTKASGVKPIWLHLWAA